MKAQTTDCFSINESALSVFSNEDLGKVRTVLIDGEPWFVAADVCRILEVINPTAAVRRLDEDEYTLISIEGASNALPINVVNEYGLYGLVLGSRKPQAKLFKRWLKHEVLPSIHKYGMYATDDLLDNPSYAAQVFGKLAAEQEANRELKKQMAELESQIAEMSSKQSGDSADYNPDAVTDRNEATTIVARQFGVSARAMNSFLSEIGVVERDKKNSKYWSLTDEYRDAGLAEYTAFWYNGYPVAESMHWTPKGQQFIHELVAERGKKVGNKILVK